LDPAKTAVVVIDMWDKHWCSTYTARVGNLVPRMNRTLEAARRLGVQVVFAPSDVAEFYRDFPQRKAVQAVPAHPEPKRVGFNPPPPPGPTDFCECGPDQPCKNKVKTWTRQHPELKIAEKDLIGDCNNSQELLNLCAERGIDTLLYMGVASNMCVQYRSMGIRNMKDHGLRAIVVADLVEAITSNGLDAAGKKDLNFTPAGGTARVQEHLERFVCPTIESRRLIDAAGMNPHAADKRPHVVFVTAEKEYETHKTLPQFAAKHLAGWCRSTFLNATADEGTGNDNIPGLEALYDADLLVLSARRRAFPVVQMDHLERYIRAGKPQVVLRTSTAAFQPKEAPRGHVIWDRFDREVLGCTYAGYNPKSRQTGCDVWRVAEAAGHPIVKDLAPAQWHSPSWIYRQRPLAEGVTVLMTGRWSTADPDEPVAWTHTYQGGRVFYTTLGHPGDFQMEPFNQLLLGAIRWALERAK
jgi:nicotinamidase-related amidase